MADNVLTPMSLTLRRSGGDWTQETFWMPEDGDYNDPELEERFPQAALERLSELRTRSRLPLAMRCFEKAVPALDADVAAAIEPYLYELEENGTTVEDASSTRNMAYDMIAFYGNCAVEYMQKTAYEICVCDWSSDVCSSDLVRPGADAAVVRLVPRGAHVHHHGGGYQIYRLRSHRRSNVRAAGPGP